MSSAANVTDADAYVALISSLPGCERLFVAKLPPLSRIRLERRLTALSSDDRETLRVLEDALSWDGYDINTTDKEAFERGRKALTSVPQTTLRQLLAERLEVRTVIAAIRLRLAGSSPPDGKWGFGRYRRQIITRWNEPDFGLDRVYPWVLEAVHLSETKDTLGFERLILDSTHIMMQRHAASHQFDFEAVAIYVLVWNIFDRWARTNAEAASRRFETMTLDAFDNYPELFAET